MNTNNKLLQTLLYATGILSTQIHAGFDFGECSGSGSFKQEIAHYAGDMENAVTVGTIPAGIIGLHINLISDKDVDIRLYGENNDKIVHWPKGILNNSEEETLLYKNIAITYSGYNGVHHQSGHEFISVEGATPTETTMKAFGYKAGYAVVNYSWTDKENCTVKENGSGHFKQDILKKEVTVVGTVPSGLNDLSIKLESKNDIDIQLYAEDGTAIIAWPKGILSQGNTVSTEYHDMKIEWSGYNGVKGRAGNEYIKITGMTTEKLMMKVFGYTAGKADIIYTWGIKSIEEEDFAPTVVNSTPNS